MTVTTADARQGDVKADLVQVTASFGANTGDFDVAKGTTIKQLFEMPHVRASLGLKPGTSTPTTVKGRLIDPHHRLNGGEEIEVIRQVDDKA